MPADFPIQLPGTDIAAGQTQHFAECTARRLTKEMKSMNEVATANQQ